MFVTTTYENLRNDLGPTHLRLCQKCDKNVKKTKQYFKQLSVTLNVTENVMLVAILEKGYHQKIELHFFEYRWGEGIMQSSPFKLFCKCVSFKDHNIVAFLSWNTLYPGVQNDNFLIIHQKVPRKRIALFLHSCN